MVLEAEAVLGGSNVGVSVSPFRVSCPQPLVLVRLRQNYLHSRCTKGGVGTRYAAGGRERR